MSWEALLQQQSQQSTYLSASSTPAITILNNWGMLHVTGDDAADYLQNLMTNDLRTLQLGQAQLTGFCNPKGRLLAIFILLRRKHGFDLLMPIDIFESIQKKLSMFILRSKVQISSDLDNQVMIGLLADENTIDGLPQQDFTAIEQHNICFLKIPGFPTRFIAFADKTEATALVQQKLDEGWQHCNPAVWQSRDIEAGLPTIFAASQERFTPQQVNLDLLNGVSFKKGCYPGQEVVARLHYLGSPSRRLFTAQLKTQTLPEPGQDAIDADGEILGQVVQAQISAPEQVKLLLTMKLALADKSGYIEGVAIEALQPLAEETV